MTRAEVSATTDRAFRSVGGLNAIVSDMLRWGPGARGIVGAWPQKGIGHYFNVANIDGKVVFLDFQSGKANPAANRYRNYLPHEDQTEMLDREQAERRAAEFLAGESRSWGPSSSVRIISEYCFTDGGQFIAPYDHIDYLDHGREDMQLGGNLPVTVDLTTGSCRFIDWEEADAFMERNLL